VPRAAKHGGARAGAGRPATDAPRAVPRSFSLPPDEDRALESLAVRLRLSVSATVRRALAELAERELT